MGYEQKAWLEFFSQIYLIQDLFIIRHRDILQKDIFINFLLARLTFAMLICQDQICKAQFCKTQILKVCLARCLFAYCPSALYKWSAPNLDFYILKLYIFCRALHKNINSRIKHIIKRSVKDLEVKYQYLNFSKRMKTRIQLYHLS